ncbi:signal peptidase I [Streptomyces sp. TBY4]|uniref:signal peptidase I n=1 Tax=Streptomyces sp. TBY4 TaxID=2962030 RepID=UPI0020B87D20|nr:signal peptidase I [Streptomyces sp. TBY4]MCP3760339.1 signal peptidase I [Streptomyces sp. TBY4]
MGRDRRRPGRRRGIWAVVLMALGPLLYAGASVLLVFLGGDGYARGAISSEAMAPAYHRGDAVWIAPVVPEKVGRGDLVLVTPPPSWESDADLLKRVIAVGGDRVSWTNGDAALTLNGERLAEPYLANPAVPAIATFDVTVPEGRIFVMSDNRAAALDSSAMVYDPDDGTLALSAVRGVAAAAPVMVSVAPVMAGLGVAALFLGGGLGIGSLVARQRAAQAARNPLPGGPGAGWAHRTAPED